MSEAITLTKDEAGTLTCAAMVTLAAMKGRSDKGSDLLADLNDIWGGTEALVAVLRKVEEQANA